MTFPAVRTPVSSHAGAAAALETINPSAHQTNNLIKYQFWAKKTWPKTINQVDLLRSIK